jgi:hypothetical protein
VHISIGVGVFGPHPVELRKRVVVRGVPGL